MINISANGDLRKFDVSSKKITTDGLIPDGKITEEDIDLLCNQGKKCALVNALSEKIGTAKSAEKIELRKAMEYINKNYSNQECDTDTSQKIVA